MSYDASNHLFETVKVHFLFSVQCQKIKKKKKVIQTLDSPNQNLGMKCFWAKYDLFDAWKTY